MKSVERVTAVLLSFTGGHAELGVTEISQHVGVPTSAVHRILEALTASGLTQKENHRGKYRLGPRAVELSLAALGTVDVRSLALPLMEALQSKVGETVTLSFAINNERIYVAQVESRQTVRMTVEIGRRAPLYAGASGRAILMTYSAEQLDAYLSDVALTPLTEDTVIGRADLEAVLERDRQRGCAFSSGERDADAAAVAAPIQVRQGKAIGCISACGPRGRLDQQRLEWCSPAVVDTAAAVSAVLSGG